MAARFYHPEARGTQRKWRNNMGYLADLFEPPYYTVIFASTRTGDDADGYGQTAAAMMALAAQQEGFLGVESLGSGGDGMTVSYWRDLDAIKAWHRNAEHREAISQGRAKWYSDFRLRVAKVERNYSLAGSGASPDASG